MVKGELKHIEHLEVCLKNKQDIVKRLNNDLDKNNEEIEKIWSDLKYSKVLYKENKQQKRR